MKIIEIFDSQYLFCGRPESTPLVFQLPSLEPAPASAFSSLDSGSIQFYDGGYDNGLKLIWELKAKHVLVKWAIDRQLNVSANQRVVMKKSFPKLSRIKEDVLDMDFVVTTDGWCCIVGKEGILDSASSVDFVSRTSDHSRLTEIPFQPVYRQPQSSGHIATLWHFLTESASDSEDTSEPETLAARFGCEIWGAHSSAPQYHSLPFVYSFSRQSNRQNMFVSRPRFQIHAILFSLNGFVS